MYVILYSVGAFGRSRFDEAGMGGETFIGPTDRGILPVVLTLSRWPSHTYRLSIFTITHGRTTLQRLDYISGV